MNKKLTPLNYKGYEKYLVHETNDFMGHGSNNDYGYRFAFPSGLELSVIKHFGSYGYNDDLFEIAVMKDGDFVHIQGITDDDVVKGYLTNEEVIEIIKELCDEKTN